ncbi:MAG: class IV adenylate cyclase [Phycisphaerae bacterium]
MSREIEIKYRLATGDVLDARVVALGAKPHGRFLERSVILDQSDRTLLAANSALRVRERISLVAGATSAQRLLTFKGPLLDGGSVKQREEIELTVSDFAAAVTLFERLGYRGVIYYERRRETWRLGECEVAIDELPDRSTFVEIEGPSVAAVQACAQSLDLLDGDRDPVSYVEYAARNGKPARGFDACLAFDDETR